MYQNWIFFSSSEHNINFKEYCDIKPFNIRIRETDVSFKGFGVHLNMSFHVLFFTNKTVGSIQQQQQQIPPLPFTGLLTSLGLCFLVCKVGMIMVIIAPTS